MASLTVQDVPEPLLDELKNRARLNRRGLSQEALYLIEDALARLPQQASIEDEIRAQVEQWSRLVGRWKSDLPVDEEIAQILAARRPWRIGR